MSIDFTDPKRAEEALQKAKHAAEESKAQYELMVSMISDILWCYEVNAIGEHVGSYISPIADKMLGLPDGTIGNSFDKYFSYVHPDDLPAAQEMLSEGIRTPGKDITTEYRMRKGDGTTLWVRSKASAYCKDGRITVFGTTSDIAELRQMEDELRESERKLRETLMDLVEGYCSVSLDGLLLDHNPAFNRILGIDIAKDLKGIRVPDFWQNPDDRKEYLNKLISRGCVRNYLVDAKTISGKKKVVLINAHLVKDEKGRALKIDGTFTDFTKCKRTEDSLRKKKEFASRLINTAQAIILVLDHQGRIMMINSYMEKVSGYRKEEVQGKDWFETFLPESERQRIKELFSRAISGTRTKGNINPIMAKDGREIIVEWNDTILHDLQGKTTGLLVIGQDITERIRAEAMLKESEKKYRRLVEIARESIIVVEDFRFKFANPMAFALFEVKSEQELIDRPFAEFTHPDERSEVVEIYSRLITNEEVPIRHDFRVVTRDGIVKWVEVNAANFEWQGKPAVLVCLTDITDRKRDEMALKKYSARLEELVEERTKQLQQAERLAAIGETATMISHDLRNPLQVIVSMVYLAKEMLTSEDTVPLDGHLRFVEILEDIEKSSSYMSRILSDLQCYGGPMDLKFADTDIRMLISDALSILEFPKGVEVSIEVENGLSEITLDPQKIKRVIVNLVDNSIQSMPKGGRIMITAIRKGESVVLSIRDEGAGIPSEDISKLFSPMVTKKAKGTGLGLAVCRRLVEAHGGNIFVTSKVNEGTEITIEIPQDIKTWTRSQY